MLILLFLLLVLSSQAQAQDSTQYVHQQQVVFWNVENAFWPADDPEKLDDDYTPEGMRHWSRSRLRQKLIQIERGLLDIGHGIPPMIVGLAEVEGDSVMHYWTHRTPLWKLGYRYVVSDKSDRRGIMTALLYQPSDFRLLSHESFDIRLPQSHSSTRQLLHVSGRLINKDTLDVIVAHLPSQYGGAKQSKDARKSAHRTMMHIADSIAEARTHPYIIIMGDMNEAPSRRHKWWNEATDQRWHNLMLPLQQALVKHPSAYGSHKYQGTWSFLDQFIVNDHLLHDSTLNCTNARSFSQDFMLTDDNTHLGKRPRRSYYGSQYEEGISDHLPIVLDLNIHF